VRVKTTCIILNLGRECLCNFLCQDSDYCALTVGCLVIVALYLLNSH